MQKAHVDEQLFQDCMRLVGNFRPQRIPASPGHLDGCRVLIVDGDLIKIQPDLPKDDTAHMDFVEGGNDLESSWVRREFGPKVFILDRHLDRGDWPYVLYHEAHERRLMEKGWTYKRAHESANAAERQLRIRRRRQQQVAR